MTKFEIYFLNKRNEFERIENLKRRTNNKKKKKKKKRHKEKENFENDMKFPNKENVLENLVSEKYNDKTTLLSNIRSSVILQNRIINRSKQTKVVERNVYEGGYTIWECTWEMLSFLNEKKFLFKNKRVLELGCGNGLVGIYILKNRGRVFFQELNKEVINDVLIPNIKQNLNIELEKEELNEKENYMKIRIGKNRFCIINKSWDVLNKYLEKKTKKAFDYIFGNEIIYRYENYDDLIKIIEKNLKKEGKAFFGAKSFYFGLEKGTGSNHFVMYLNSMKDSPLVAEIIKSNKNKSVYTKDIVQISFKKKCNT